MYWRFPQRGTLITVVLVGVNGVTALTFVLTMVVIGRRQVLTGKSLAASVLARWNASVRSAVRTPCAAGCETPARAIHHLLGACDYRRNLVASHGAPVRCGTWPTSGRGPWTEPRTGSRAATNPTSAICCGAAAASDVAAAAPVPWWHQPQAAVCLWWKPKTQTGTGGVVLVIGVRTTPLVTTPRLPVPVTA